MIPETPARREADSSRMRISNREMISHCENDFRWAVEWNGMASPLEEIEFLARSGNRIEVLATLASGSYTRRELGDVTGASQPTLGRILNDLSDRNWIAYDGDRYRATPTGELVADGITDLRERLETETKLREVVEWLPTEVMDVDLRAFEDAKITTPSSTRPNAPLSRMVELLERTGSARLLSHSFNSQKLDLLERRTTAGDLRAEGVFAADAIDAVAADPDLRGRLEAVVAAGQTDLRVYDGEVPLALELTDDRTHLLLRDEAGVVRGSLDTDNETVRSWAESVYERYWSAASPLDADELET